MNRSRLSLAGLLLLMALPVSLDFLTRNQPVFEKEQITSGEFAPAEYINAFAPTNFVEGITPTDESRPAFTHDLDIPVLDKYEPVISPDLGDEPEYADAFAPSNVMMPPPPSPAPTPDVDMSVLRSGWKALQAGCNEFGQTVLSQVAYINDLPKNVGYGSNNSHLILVTPRIIISEEEEPIQWGVGEQ